jgi:hypothetical protein
LLNLLKAADPCLADRMRCYSEQTGIPLEECVNEAISVFLDCIGSVNLEALKERETRPKLSLV